MTRQQFFEKLRHIRQRASPQVDAEARRAVRIASLKAIAKVQQVLLAGGNSESVRIALDKRNLAKEWIDAVNFAKEKTATITAKANAEFMVSQLTEAGIKLKENAVEGITEDIVNKVLKKPKQPFSQNSRLQNARLDRDPHYYKAQGWSPGQGVGFYTTDPATGKKTIVNKSFYMQFSKKYDLSSSVWQNVEETESTILNTIWAARAQGRDAVKTAKDIEKLVLKGGKEKILGSWGELKPGTKAYAKRIGNNGIDYRALRIVRTENARSMNDAIKQADELNPSTTGEFEWVLVKSREEWNCECEELAAGGPYTAENLPEIPAHPNCLCQLRPVLKDWKEFAKELEADGGEKMGNLDKWVSGGVAELPQGESVFDFDAWQKQAAEKATTETKTTDNLPENHIAKTNPQYKDLFNKDGAFKNYSDFEPTVENKKNFYRSIGFHNGKAMEAGEFEPFYNAVKDVTDEIPSLLKNSNGKAAFGDFVKGWDNRRPNWGGRFYPDTKTISFSKNLNQSEVEQGITKGLFRKGMTVKDINMHEMFHALTLNGETKTAVLRQRARLTANLRKILKDEYGITKNNLAGQEAVIRQEISGYAANSFRERIIDSEFKIWAGCEAYAETGWIYLKEGSKAGRLIKGLMKVLLKNLNK